MIRHRTDKETLVNHYEFETPQGTIMVRVYLCDGYASSGYERNSKYYRYWYVDKIIRKDGYKIVSPPYNFYNECAANVDDEDNAPEILKG